jgi:hypothetical protein
VTKPKEIRCACGFVTLIGKRAIFFSGTRTHTWKACEIRCLS